MALEIERKWLIDPADVPFDLGAVERHRIEQSYLSFHPQVRLRNVDDGARFLLTVKASVHPPEAGAGGRAETPPGSPEAAADAPDADGRCAGAAAVAPPDAARQASLARTEFEAEITPASYASLRPQAVGKTLLKTRYVVPAEAGRVWEIDIYEGEFAGLAVAEMEFASEEDACAFPDPSWVARDISYDPAFRNVCMAQG